MVVVEDGWCERRFQQLRDIISRMRRSVLHFFLAVMLPIFGGSTGTAGTEYSKSLRFACSNDPFLSVSVSSPRHDRFLNIELELVDPAGRKVGYSDENHPIPRSQYGKVVEIPSHPERSKAVAVEICGASERDV